jgi:hypothetical protein
MAWKREQSKPGYAASKSSESHATPGTIDPKFDAL